MVYDLALTLYYQAKRILGVTKGIKATVIPGEISNY